MNLYKAELHRTLRRRLSLVFGIIAGAAVIVVSGWLWFASSNTVSEAEWAEAEAMAQESNAEYERCLENEEFFQEEWGWGENDPELESLSHEEACAQFTWAHAEPEDFIYQYTFNFADEGVMTLLGLMIFAALLMMLLSASAVGAEWPSAGIANLLVWHPSRMTVWGAKLSAVLTVTLAVMAAVGLLGFGLLLAVASVRGEVGELNGAFWDENLPQIARTVALGLGMSVLGASLAMLGRHTAIAGAVIVGYLTVGELMMTFVRFGSNMDFPELLSLYTWVGAWVSGKMTLYSWDPVGDIEQQLLITATDAGLVLGGIIALFAVLGTWSFARRDIA